MNKNVIKGLVTLCLLGTVGCDSEDDEHDAVAFEAYAKAPTILSTHASAIAVPSYTTLDQKVDVLQAAVSALHGDPTAANLAAAQTAWKDAMASYEIMETWRFGPSSSYGLSKSLETFPVDTAFIETTLASTQVLDQDFVTGSANADKGFHAVEYLLFGSGNSRTAGELTARHLEYLVSLVGVTKTGTSTLVQAWTTGVQGAPPFETTFAQPGPSNATYPTFTAAGGDLMEGIEDALSHAYKKKMQTPIGTGMVSNLESSFSQNSLQDIRNNLLSVQYSYNGVDSLTGANGPGVISYIQSRNKDVDAMFRAQVAAALQSLDAIPPPLETAMTDPAQQDVINAAIAAIQTAHDNYVAQVQPLLAAPDAD